MSERPEIENLPPLLSGLAKIAIFVGLAVVGGIVTANNWWSTYGGIPVWYVVLPAVVVLLAENAVKIWAVTRYGYKIACYVTDILLLLTITIFTDGMLISTFYLIILTEFYIGQKSFISNIVMGASSIGLFLITLGVSSALRDSLNVLTLVSSAFNDLVLLLLHFFALNFAMQIYRKNTEITQVLGELRESNEQLTKLNEELKEITVLEERQRIAKDIHDTAGHSITTVIMQTEAAKLVLENDPEDAKRKIAAANLQAKHALEELRESVHLLSGSAQQLTLREMLLEIVSQTMEGTDVVIRTDIDEVSLCDAKRRFLCNSLKEGISNGLRHGGATAFWFELKREGDKVRFLLSDNGCGMDANAFREGFGLTGMHTRAEALGGSVFFDTEPDEGFEIHITLPLDGEKGEEV